MKTRLMRWIAVPALLAGLALASPPAQAAQPEDAWITTKVKMALLSDDLVHGLDVNVDTFDAAVTLHGTVDSEAEKARAEQRAKEIQGVREVRNLLAVVPARAAEQVAIADAELKSQIATVLERDKALDDSKIQVKSVNKGVVVLSGEAKTLSDHRRALEDARSVKGVRQVASEIRSPDELADAEIWVEGDGAGQSPSTQSAYDSWITTKAKVRLMAEPGLNPVSINVDTNQGIVTLFGIVETQEIKSRAEAQVKKITGVKAVENELQVVPQVSAATVEAQDDKLVTTVEERLEAREALKDADIDVEVKNGVVRLTGTVTSYGDRLTALSVARGTPGVNSVIDALQLTPPASSS